MTDLFPPFEPDKDPRPRRFNAVPLRLLIPNLVTLLSLCAGLTAIRFAYEGQLRYALIAVLVAAILDGLDGRIARLLKGTSRFGAELDSLADFLSFGVSPAIILYIYGLNELNSIGWITVILFTSASALRLARFNVMIDDPNKPAWAGHFFVGMPSPAGAIVVMLPIYLAAVVEAPLNARPWALLEVCYVALIAFSILSAILLTFGTKNERTAGWYVGGATAGAAALGYTLTRTTGLHH